MLETKSKRDSSSSSIRRTTRYKNVYKLLRREERKAGTDRRKGVLIMEIPPQQEPTRTKLDK